MYNDEEVNLMSKLLKLYDNNNFEIVNKKFKIYANYYFKKKFVYSVYYDEDIEDVLTIEIEKNTDPEILLLKFNEKIKIFNLITNFSTDEFENLNFNYFSIINYIEKKILKFKKSEDFTFLDSKLIFPEKTIIIIQKNTF